MRKQWEVQQRLIAGIVEAPPGRFAGFFTLTFPAAQQPTEDELQRAWRALVGRLRRRDLLGAYGWTIQRTKRGTLHMHGVGHFHWDPNLTRWRAALTASGFGIQNTLVVARATHARYCARYIGTRFAELAPLRRAFGFSQGFPRTPHMKSRRERAALEAALAPLGVVPDCHWIPEWEVASH